MRKSFLLVALVLFVSGGFATTKWVRDSALVTYLPTASNTSLPAIYDITGDGAPDLVMMGDTFVGYLWYGHMAWLSNDTLVSGIPSISDAKPSIYDINNDGAPDMIIGSKGGTFTGYSWNGSGWDSNDTLVSGIPSIEYGAPTIHDINNDGAPDMIIGSKGGTFTGYSWNGSGWDSNDTLVSGIPNYSYGAPMLYNTNSLIVIGSAPAIGGYSWNGTQWVTNASLINGIPLTGQDTGTAISDIDGDNKLDMLVGEVDGYPLGYSLDTLPVITNVHIAPDPAYTVSTLTCEGDYSDADWDSESGSSYRWFKNGALIAGQTGKTLSNGHFSKDDNITCEYTPSDGYDYGTPLNSSIVQVGKLPSNLEEDVPDSVNVGTPFTVHAFYTDNGNNPIRDGVSCEVSYENNTDSMSWNEDLNDWEAEITLSQQGAVDIQADCTSTVYEDASDVVTVGITPYLQPGPSAAIPKPITTLVTQSTIYGTVASSEFVMAFPGLTIAVTIFNMIGGLL